MSEQHQSDKAKQPKSDKSMASLGGKASAAKLTPEERTERAKMAAEARWHKDVVIAPHNGTITIAATSGETIEIPCCVLADGTRVLHERGVMKALGVTRSGGSLKPGGDGARLPLFISQKNLTPFLDEDLSEVLKKPIWYRPPSGLNRGRPHKGLRAELLPKVCNVWLTARDAGVLGKAQLVVAANADILSRGMALVGITALVDEATGFQDVRARDALAKILEKFVAEAIQPYLSTFPVDFFRELCRLKNIPFRENMRLPKYFGRLVNSLVYCRLAPGVLDELQRKNPVAENGRRKNKNYKWLTPVVGHPKLVMLLGSEVTLMRMSKSWDEFKTLVDKYHEVYKALPSMPLFEWAEKNNSGNDG